MKKSNRWGMLIGIIPGLLLVLYVAARIFAWDFYSAPSESMAPSIKPGSYVMVKKWGYGHYGLGGITFVKAAITAPMERGDILAIIYPVDNKTTYLKRLIGLPGDRIDYHDKKLQINGQAVKTTRLEDYLFEDRLIYLQQFNEALPGHEHKILINKDLRTMDANSVMNFPHRENCQYENEGFLCVVPPGNYFVMGDNRDNSADSRHWGFVPAGNVMGKLTYIFQ